MIIQAKLRGRTVTQVLEIGTETVARAVKNSSKPGRVVLGSGVRVLDGEITTNNAGKYLTVQDGTVIEFPLSGDLADWEAGVSMVYSWEVVS